MDQLTMEIRTGSTIRSLAAALAISGAVAFGTSGALAAGDGGGSGSSGDGTTQPNDCTSGSDCNDETKLYDDAIYQRGAQLAQAGQYESAIEVLQTARDQNDPRILNYIGYSYRKMGEFGTGFAYYTRALEINPDYVLAREYLGEGYVSIGRIDKAEEQLAEIEQRCGATCSEYQQLAQVITDARNGLSAEW